MGEILLLLYNVSSVASRATVLINARIKLCDASNVERQVTVLQIARMMGRLVITAANKVTLVLIVWNQRRFNLEGNFCFDWVGDYWLKQIDSRYVFY